MATISHRGGSGVVSAITGEELQAVIDSFDPELGGFIQLPSTLNLYETVTVSRQERLKIKGPCNINWYGTSGGAFDFISTLDCELSDVNFYFANAGTHAVRLTDEGAGFTRSSGFLAKNWWVDANAGSLDQVIHIDRTPDGGKNDHHTFDTIRAQEYGFAFARVEGQAAVNIRFIGCLAQAREYGQYGIYNQDDDNANEGGQILVDGGIWMEHSVADFHFNTRLGSNVLRKVFSEQSAQLLIVPNSSAACMSCVSIEDIRWSTNSAKQASHHEVIQVAAGKLLIDGGTLGLSNPSLELLIKYQVTGASKQLGWTVRNLTICSTIPATSHWQTGDAPTVKENVHRWDGSTTTLL